jgi:hypothetical protein
VPVFGGMGCVTSRGAGVGGVVLMSGGVFKRTSKTFFGTMVWLSFRWWSVVYNAYIWNLSSVLKVCSFAMVFQHLYCIVNGAKGVIVFHPPRHRHFDPV